MEALKIGLSLAVVSLCAAALPATSHAQDSSVRLNVGGTIGLAGEAKAEIDDVDDDDQPDGADLDPTFGLHAGIEVPLHQYFTLGGEFGMSFWQTEDDDGDRQKQLDVLARPKLRISPVQGLELYGVVPVGLTYYIPSEDMSGEEMGYKVDFKGGPGFAVGVGAGATYFVTEHFGLNAEAGYLYRKFNMSIEESLGDQSASTDAKGSFGQLQLRAGVSIAF